MAGVWCCRISPCPHKSSPPNHLLYLSGTRGEVDFLTLPSRPCRVRDVVVMISLILRPTLDRHVKEQGQIPPEPGLIRMQAGVKRAARHEWSERDGRLLRQTKVASHGEEDGKIGSQARHPPLQLRPSIAERSCGVHSPEATGLCAVPTMAW